MGRGGSNDARGTGNRGTSNRGLIKQILEDFLEVQQWAPIPSAGPADEIRTRIDKAARPPGSGGAQPEPLQRGNEIHNAFERLYPGRIPDGLKPYDIVVQGVKIGTADRVDFKRGCVYEIKSSEPSEVAAGQIQLASYLDYLNRKEPRPDGGKWQGEVVTYDVKEARARYESANREATPRTTALEAPSSPPKQDLKVSERESTPGREGNPAKTRGGSPDGAFAVANVGLGIVYTYASTVAIQKRAATEGYVPFGAAKYDGESTPLKLARWFLDPTLGDNVPFEQRFQIAPWRQNMRDLANSKQPGETLSVEWDVGLNGFEESLTGLRQKTEKVRILYKKHSNGIWVDLALGSDVWPADAPVKNAPSLNHIIDPKYTDDQIQRELGLVGLEL
jgi:hypothetical protein